MLQLLTSFIYTAVENSWLFASLSLKYLIGAQIVYQALNRDLSLESFSEIVEKYSREVVSVIALVGLLASFIGFRVPLHMEVVGQGTALLYFGYLFWRF